MIIYEVTAMLDPSLCDAFEGYMRQRHIPDVIASGYFEDASFERLTPGRYRTRYTIETRNALERYFAEAAPLLRRDFEEHFPVGVELFREEWDVVETYSGQDCDSSSLA